MQGAHCQLQVLLGNDYGHLDLGGGNHLDVHDHSISSGSVVSGMSSNSLAKDFSGRSENMAGHQRVMSFRIGTKSGGQDNANGLKRDTSKSIRLSAGEGYTCIRDDDVKSCYTYFAIHEIMSAFRISIYQT